MTYTRTVLVIAAMAFAVPLASASAQTASSQTKCGPVAFSTDKMAYTSAPCAAGVAEASPQAPAPQTTASSGMPMQARAMPMGDQCGALDTIALKDEYGRKYNCRGDRIR